jgi:hypothetical protein
MIKKSEGLGHLFDTMCDLVCSVEETRKKLNSAKAKLLSADKKNEQVNALIEKWAVDVKLSEKIVLSVQSGIEKLIVSRAA